MPAPIAPNANFFNWLQQYFQDKPIGLSEIAGDPEQLIRDLHEASLEPDRTDAETLQHLSGADPAYLEMPPPQPGMAISPMGLLDPSQVAQQPGFLGPGETYPNSLAEQEGPIWGPDEEQAARDEANPPELIQAGVAEHLYGQGAPLDLPEMSFKGDPGPAQALDSMPPPSGPTGPAPASAGRAARSPRGGPGAAPSPGAPTAPVQYFANQPFGPVAEEDQQYPEDAAGAPGALPAPGAPFNPAAPTSQVDLTAAADNQEQAAPEGPDEFERMLMEQAQRQPPHWTKALGLIGLGLTNPQAALQILGNDEQARQTAMQMLVKLGMDKKEAARFEKRLQQQEMLQDKRMKAAEDRQATRMEQQQFRDALDQVTRYANSVGAGHLLTPDRLKDRAGIAGIYGELDKLKVAAEEKKQFDTEVRSMISSKAPSGMLMSVLGVSSLAELQQHPDEGRRRFAPALQQLLAEEAEARQVRAQRARYTDAQISSMKQNAKLAEARTAAADKAKTANAAQVRAEITTTQSSINALTRRITQLQTDRANPPLGLDPETAAIRDLQLGGELESLQRDLAQEQFRLNHYQRRRDELNGLASNDPNSPLAPNARVFSDPGQAFEAALNEVTNELAAGDRGLALGDYSISGDPEKGDPLERQFLFRSQDTLSDWDDIATQIAERFRRFYPRSLTMDPVQLQAVIQQAFAARARQQAMMFVGSGTGYHRVWPNSGAYNAADAIKTSGPTGRFPIPSAPSAPSSTEAK